LQRAARSREHVARALGVAARFERIAAIVPGAIYELQKGADGRERLLYASLAFKDIFGVDPAVFPKMHQL